MKQQIALRILILEDNPADTDLLQNRLKRDFSAIEFFCSSDKEEFEKGLMEFHPDLVLSDNSLPQFSASEALEIVRKKYPHLPFILVTGTVSEEFAVTIIKNGADDYVLKDRMTRLPAAIEVALKQRRAQKEISDYKYALDQTAIVSIMDSNGVISYINENFTKLSGYSPEEMIGGTHKLLNSGQHNPGFFEEMWEVIRSGKIWEGEILNKSKDGEMYWIDTTIIPFLNGNGEPYQYLAISHNISEKKRLQARLIEQYRNEQLRVMATSLAAQEKERNLIGQELHDNVNQILVGTKLLLTMLLTTENYSKDILQLCLDNMNEAVDENRKLAHTLVTPDLETSGFMDQLNRLWENMLIVTGITIHIDDIDFNESYLSRQEKLTIYRITQEQCTNIVKYAQAKNVYFVLSTQEGVFRMTIKDDGQGSSSAQVKGIGLKNISGRLSLHNGIAKVKSAPGEGFTLEVEMKMKQAVMIDG